MIGVEQENARFARALKDEFPRKRLVVEYARRSEFCGWAAVLPGGLAFVEHLIPTIQAALSMFLCVALGSVIICLKLRRDLMLLRLAGQQQPEETPCAQHPQHSASAGRRSIHL